MEVSHKVRVVTVDGAPWFVAADVCRVLGIINTTSAVKTLAADERTTLDRIKVGMPGGAAVNVVSESGLYKLIMRSDKPIARPFQDWVTREVLPSIRKTGSFTLAPGETIPLPANFTDALRQHAATLIKLAEEQEAHAKTQAERDAAAAAKAKAEAEVSRLEPMAKAVGKFAHKIGQLPHWRRQ